jgi:hypothetical protein
MILSCLLRVRRKHGQDWGENIGVDLEALTEKASKSMISGLFFAYLNATARSFCPETGKERVG